MTNRVTLHVDGAGAYSPHPLRKDETKFEIARQKDKHKTLSAIGEVLQRGYEKEDRQYIEIPFSTFGDIHIANMLRVLFGMRPIPTLRRTTSYHRGSGDPTAVAAIESMLAGIRVNITAGYHNKFTDKKHCHVVWESQATRKGVSDSWLVDGAALQCGTLQRRLSWHEIECQMEPDAFADFQVMVVDVLGAESLGTDLVSVLDQLAERQSPRTYKYFQEEHPELPKPYRDVVLDRNPKAATGIGHMGGYHGLPHWHWLMVNHGHELINRRSGLIHVPVQDEHMHLFERGNGHAKLLDGGLVRIVEIAEWLEYEVQGEPVFVTGRKAKA